MRLGALATTLVVVAPLAARAQVAAGGDGGTPHSPTVQLVNPGPRSAAVPLQRALAAPHRVLAPDSARAVVSRDSSYPASVVVLGRDAVVEGHVQGDVIVVGGDLFMHPGATVDGAAIAIGGGAYPSDLATVHGGLESRRDYTYDVAPGEGGFALSYRSLREGSGPAVTLTGFHGLQIPSYDRTDGLSVPAGALVTLDSGLLEITPTVTYRSQLGAWDPWATVRWQPNERYWLVADAGRTTMSNDRWIWSDLVNSAAVLWEGIDTRNYYRADRAQLELHRLIPTGTGEVEPWIGARYERDWAARPLAGAVGGPWSVTDRDYPDRVVRPNPFFPSDHIASGVAGIRAGLDVQTVRVDGTLEEELGSATLAGNRFAQSTVNLTVSFPTFGTQSFDIVGHAVLTAGDRAPVPRTAYLGGAGTFKLIPLLSLGGDQLLYLESAYNIPIDRLTLPMVGPPTLTLLHVMGSAGMGSLPRLEQNLALRLALSVVRVDFILDATRRKSGVSAGLAMAR